MSVTPVTPVATEEVGFFTRSWNWISDTAVKVWEAVKGFFQAIGRFFVEHKEGFIWGAIALVTGGLAVAVFWLIHGCCKKDPEPITAKALLAKVEQAATDAKSAEGKKNLKDSADALKKSMAQLEKCDAAVRELPKEASDEAKKGANKALNDMRNVLAMLVAVTNASMPFIIKQDAETAKEEAAAKPAAAPGK